jgi:methyl-accepting chemotaxis protein
MRARRRGNMRQWGLGLFGDRVQDGRYEQEIGNLNGISGDVVGALTSIKKAIQEVSEYVTSTAAAVEEQSTVTSEMSNGMQQAAAEAASIGVAA